MKKLIAQSARNVNSDWLLVVIFATLQFAGALPVAKTMSLLLFIPMLVVVFVLFVALLGRIAERCANKEISTVASLLKQHSGNIALVVLALWAPFVVLKDLSTSFNVTSDGLAIVLDFIRTLFRFATVFVLPIVVLRRIGLLAILVGFEFLYRNFRQSIPILSIFLTTFLIQLMLAEVMESLPAGMSINYARLLLWVSVVLGEYLALLAFSAACAVIVIGDSKTESIQG